MAYSSIVKPGDYFNTVTYSNAGDGAKAVTGVGFQPGLVWLKNRTVTYHPQIHDAVRGASNGSLYTDVTNAVDSGYPISSFDSNGFTTGSQSSNESQNSANQVAWNWKANGAGSANTDGSINSTVSVNTTAGFSIVSYTGTGANATVGHGLGSVPGVIIIKDRDNGTGFNWRVYHHKNTSAPETDALNLNLTNATNDNSTYWNDTAPTSSVFTIGTDASLNYSGDDYIAYCFAEKKGYSKFGSYTGGSDPFVYLGFKPAFVMFKNASATENWRIVDNKRDVDNPVVQHLYPNLSNAEGSGASYNDFVDFTAQGFKIISGSGEIDGSGNTIIYMAFAEAPFVTSSGVPTTAR